MFIQKDMVLFCQNSKLLIDLYLSFWTKTLLQTSVIKQLNRLFQFVQMHVFFPRIDELTNHTKQCSILI